MRIISGTLRGRRLATVRGDVRPTTDRLRESVFSYLGQELAGSVWIDLFAGSGAIGLEAISRGAKFVCFNDKQDEAVKVLKKNLEICTVQGGYTIESKDAFLLLKTPPLSEGPADFVYVDPPYEFGRYDKLLKKIVESPAFGPRTTILVEVFRKTRTDFVPPELVLGRTIQGGDSHVLVLRPAVAPGEVSLGPEPPDGGGGQ